jgi:hypothetical protein
VPLHRAAVTDKHRVRRKQPSRHCSAEECSSGGEERIAGRWWRADASTTVVERRGYRGGGRTK